MADQEFPKWLQRLVAMNDEQLKAQGWTRDEVEDAKGGYLRQADYTKKTQEIAPLRAVIEKHGAANVDWEKAAEWYGWGANEWPKFKAAYEQREQELTALRTELDGIRRGGNGNGAGAGNGGVRIGSRSWKTSMDDVFTNTQRLYEGFNEVADTVLQEVDGRVGGRLKEWWEKETAPLVQGTADRYMATALELVRPLWEMQLKDSGLSFDDIMKAAAASGTRDFGKVLASERERIATLKRQGFDEGHARGIEESRGAGAGNGAGGGQGGNGNGTRSEPTGPTGGSQPFWKPAPDGAARPKTRDELFNKVVTNVQEKRGEKLAL